MQNELCIAICEDSQEDTELLVSLLKKLEKSFSVETFSHGEGLLCGFYNGKFDLIFLDIYMNGSIGTDIAKTIRKEDEDVIIAFTTTSIDHTLESYRLGALKYLEKPVLEKDVLSLLSFVKAKKKMQPTISVLSSGKHEEIPLASILYFEVRNHIVLIHTVSGVIKTSQSVRLDDIEEIVPQPPFLRCHHSFIINMKYVQDVDRDFKMKNGATAYIRRNDVKKCTDIFKTFLLDELRREDI